MHGDDDGESVKRQQEITKIILSADEIAIPMVLNKNENECPISPPTFTNVTDKNTHADIQLGVESIDKSDGDISDESSNELCADLIEELSNSSFPQVVLEDSNQDIELNKVSFTISFIT